MMTLALGCAMAQRSPERADPPSRSNPPRSNTGRIPSAPQRRAPDARPEEERSPTGHVNSTPHVRNDHWYGHDAPNDKRYQMSRPFEHGRFEHIGSSYRYNIVRIDTSLHRFWLPGGFYFEIAAWDCPFAPTGAGPAATIS